MENRAYALAAGLFVLVLGVALAAAGVWLGGARIEEDRYVLHTRGSVTGLNVQAPVRYRGVAVGKVGAIRFDTEDARVILVEIAVRRGTPLTAGTFGQLAAQGVTGLSYVQLNDDGSSAVLRDPADPQQARIELRPSFIERVAEAGEQVLGRVETLARRLDAWLGEENRQQAKRTLTALEGAARGIGQIADDLRPGARALPSLADQAAGTLRRADALMADLGVLSATVGKRLDTLDRIAGSAERAGDAAHQLSVSGTALVSSVSRDTLPRLNGLIDEIARNSRGLERLIDELSANPSSLLFGKSTLPPGPGEPGFEREAIAR